jgi:hypothetical protein
MDRGVTAEYIQLGGTKLNEDVPYRVVLDRMSHEVPYYSVYLKMAMLQGAYVINNTFWRIADEASATRRPRSWALEPRTVVCPTSIRRRHHPDSLRNLWPDRDTDSRRALHHEAPRRRLEGRTRSQPPSYPLPAVNTRR